VSGRAPSSWRTSPIAAAGANVRAPVARVTHARRSACRGSVTHPCREPEGTAACVKPRAERSGNTGSRAERPQPASRKYTLHTKRGARARDRQPRAHACVGVSTDTYAHERWRYTGARVRGWERAHSGVSTSSAATAAFAGLCGRLHCTLCLGDEYDALVRFMRCVRWPREARAMRGGRAERGSPNGVESRRSALIATRQALREA